MALLRRAWFQIHWFIGITAGSVLLVIGLSGAMLSFRAEITDLIDPALRRVPHAADAQPLAPAELLDRLQAAPARAARGDADAVRGSRPPGARELRAAARRAPRRDAPGRSLQRRPAARAPRRGLLRVRRKPAPLAADAARHRQVGHGHPGRGAAGARTVGPVPALAAPAARVAQLAAAGLRAHAAAPSCGTCTPWRAPSRCSPIWCPASTGIYWGFDAVRTLIDDAAGEGRAVRTQRMQGAPGAPVRLDLQRVWRSFQQTTSRRLEPGHAAPARAQCLAGRGHLPARRARARARAQPALSARRHRRGDAARALCRQAAGRPARQQHLSPAHGHLLGPAGPHRDDAQRAWAWRCSRSPAGCCTWAAAARSVRCARSVRAWARPGGAAQGARAGADRLRHADRPRRARRPADRRRAAARPASARSSRPCPT